MAKIDPRHKKLAEDAAVKIDSYLSEHSDTFRVSVYGNPPTISVQLSVIAAHRLIDAVLEQDDVDADSVLKPIVPDGLPCPRCHQPMFKVYVDDDEDFVWGHDCPPD